MLAWSKISTCIPGYEQSWAAAAEPVTPAPIIATFMFAATTSLTSDNGQKRGAELVISTRWECYSSCLDGSFFGRSRIHHHSMSLCRFAPMMLMRMQ